MNDYLAALVGRAEGRLPVLGRRPRSLFEPEAAASAPNIELREYQQEKEGAVPMSTPADGFNVRSHSEVDGGHGALSSATPRVPELTTNINLSPHRAMRDQPTAHRDSLLAPDHIGVVTHRPTLNAQDEQPRALRMPQRGTAPIRLDETAAARYPRRTPAIDDASASARRDVEARQVDSDDQPITVLTPGHPVRRTGSIQHRHSPPSQSAVLLARAQTIPGMRRDLQPVAVPTPPPVQISIGRVEIRAVQAAVDKPHAVGPAAPRLSLDDYLRARNGAAR
jgi:hypothetical protein